ncbi:hypothetical protein Daus18300_012867 [Diaporthe australafricana]|uniref:ribonuclease H n=1 Tax=Diaporthe australafricana TaxID=127596 RepID=A0ABR3W163_9PEZI
MPLPSREEFLAAFGMSEPEKRRGTGINFPAKFIPFDERHRGLPKLHYGVVFCMAPDALMGVDTPRERFIGYDDRRAALMFTDGACLNNGQPNAKAGWAVWFGPEHEARTIFGRLEHKGPFGDVGEQTSNRAELRAAIAGLRCLPWIEDGYNRVVIASDSEYLVEGATAWLKKWIANGWNTARGDAVKNKDLWEMLLGEVERYHEARVVVDFWKILREYNVIADRGAKEGAEMPDEQEFVDIMVPGI